MENNSSVSEHFAKLTTRNDNAVLVATAVVISIPISFLNLFTVGFFFFSRKLRKPTNYPIASFLLASAMQSLLVLPIYIHKRLEEIPPDQEGWICDLYRVLYFYTQHIIKISLLLVSFDRLIAVKCAYRYKNIMTRRSVTWILIFGWLGTLLIDLIPFFPSPKRRAENTCSYIPRHYWGLTVIIAFDLSPFILMTINYIVIWRVAASITRRDNRQMMIARRNETRLTENNEFNECHNPIYEHNNRIPFNAVISYKNYRGDAYDKTQSSRDDANNKKLNELSIYKAENRGNDTYNKKQNESIIYKTQNNNENNCNNKQNESIIYKIQNNNDDVSNKKQNASIKDFKRKRYEKRTTRERITRGSQIACHVNLRNRNSFKVAWEMKATRTSLLICLVYAVCWFPMGVFYTIDNICDKCLSDNHHDNIETTKIVVKFICLSSSVFMPLVYCWQSKEFRNELVRILCKKLHYRRKMEAFFSAGNHSPNIAIVRRNNSRNCMREKQG